MTGHELRDYLMALRRAQGWDEETARRRYQEEVAQRRARGWPDELTPQQKRLRASLAFDAMFPNAHPPEGYGV